ncbi:MAG: hypothetical protein AAF586_00510 [Planctomycetota bacterium]
MDDWSAIAVIAFIGLSSATFVQQGWLMSRAVRQLHESESQADFSLSTMQQQLKRSSRAFYALGLVFLVLSVVLGFNFFRA